MDLTNLTEKELKSLKSAVDARLKEVIALRSFAIYSKPKARTPYGWMPYSGFMGKEKAIAAIKSIRKGVLGKDYKFEIHNGLGERINERR